jgi:hypothetical protein
MEPDNTPSSPETGQSAEVLTPAYWGTGLVFAALEAEPFAGRSTTQTRRARVRRLEALRPAAVFGD